MAKNLKKLFMLAWKRHGAALAFIVLPALLAVFRYAPAGLNADIILNQLMSINNVTLFYWGQNRLLNLLPFLLQPVTWPLANLFFVLLAATLSFFGAMRLSVVLAGKIASAMERRQVGAAVYMINIAGCCLLFKSDAWVSICLWHFEYSLATVLILCNVMAVYYGPAWLGALSFVAAFLALGLNPALVLLLAPLMACKAILMGRISGRDCLCLAAWILFFVIWVLAGRAYGKFDDYSTLVFGAYNYGMEKLLVNIFSEYFYAGRVVLIAAAIIAWRLAGRASAWLHEPRAQMGNRICLCVILSAMFYASVVVCIRWYHMNEFSPRYFIFIVYLTCFVVSIRLWPHMERLAPKARKWCGVVLLAIVCIYLRPHGFNLFKADIYNECHNMLPAGRNLYVGNYWKIWACVSRDMNRGHDSHALGYRSEADTDAICRELEMEMGNMGQLQIYCLDSPVDECRRQLGAYFERYDMSRIERRNKKTLRLTLENARLAGGACN